MGILYMNMEETRTRLDSIDEEIGFLEEISNPSPLIEEKLEELRTLRHEYERKLNYEKN